MKDQEQASQFEAEREGQVAELADRILDEEEDQVAFYQ